MAEFEVLCDVCGRPSAASTAGKLRLSYCPSCQRFACTTCWIPSGGLCRVCLLGADVAQGRLRPRISETLQASPTLPALQRRKSSQPLPTPAWIEPVANAQRGGTARRRPGWRLPVVAAAAVIIGGLVLLNLPSVPRPDVDGRSATLEPGVLPLGSPSPALPTASAVGVLNTHVIVAGDTLLSIAEAVYGDASLWRTIYEANRDTISDPESLRVGESLVIPPR